MILQFILDENEAEFQTRYSLYFVTDALKGHRLLKGVRVLQRFYSCLRTV